MLIQQTLNSKGMTLTGKVLFCELNITSSNMKQKNSIKFLDPNENPSGFSTACSCHLTGRSGDVYVEAQSVDCKDYCKSHPG